MYISGQRINEI